MSNTRQWVIVAAVVLLAVAVALFMNWRDNVNDQRRTDRFVDEFLELVECEDGR